MKRTCSCLAALVLLASAELSAEPGPQLVRVHLEYIGVRHELLTELMEARPVMSDAALHAHLRGLAKTGGAQIHETGILTLQSGERASMESVMEYIYPTEYSPGGLGSFSLPVDPMAVFKSTRPVDMAAFETRNLGVTLEVEAIAGRDGKFVELQLSPEILDLSRLLTWREYRDAWGDANTRMPAMEFLRLHTGLTVANGKFGFAGALSSRLKKRGLDPNDKILLFVKADVLRVGDAK